METITLNIAGFVIIALVIAIIYAVDLPEDSGSRKTKRTKSDMGTILQTIKDIIAQFHMKMSLRQVYYQLVTRHAIKNNINEYKMTSRILVNARKSGEVDYEDIEDRTRTVNDRFTQHISSMKNDIDSVINYAKHCMYSIPDASYQPKLHIIGLEKQALEGIFKDNIPGGKNCFLVVCRGYNSLTQIHDLVEAIKSKKQIKEIHVSYFGDHDPTGFDIERNFRDQLVEEFEMPITSFERIGITRAQITQYNLPDDPAKETDARTASWLQGGCVELDAIPPNELIRLIRTQINKFWDKDIEKEVDKLNTVLGKIFRRKMAKRLQEEFSVDEDEDSDDDSDEDSDDSDNNSDSDSDSDDSDEDSDDSDNN